MSLLNKLESKDPKCDVVFTAVNTLKNKKQISEFCEEFIQRGKDQGGLDPGAYLKTRVYEALDFYPQARIIKIKNTWNCILSDLPPISPGKRTSL